MCVSYSGSDPLMCEFKTYYFITKKGIFVKHLVIFFVEICAMPTFVRRWEPLLSPKFDLPGQIKAFPSFLSGTCPGKNTLTRPPWAASASDRQRTPRDDLHRRRRKGHAQASSRHATPGSSLPSRNSRLAPPRRSPLHIPRFRLPAKARSFRSSSSPHRNHFVGFRRGPPGMISTVAGAKVMLRHPAGTQRPAVPYPPGTPGWRHRRWRCGSSCRRSPAAPRQPRCRRRR